MSLFNKHLNGGTDKTHFSDINNLICVLYSDINNYYVIDGLIVWWVERDGYMGGWMDGWMDGWIDGWVDGWMDGWIDGGIIRTTS